MSIQFFKACVRKRMPIKKVLFLMISQRQKKKIFAWWSFLEILYEYTQQKYSTIFPCYSHSPIMMQIFFCYSLLLQTTSFDHQLFEFCLIEMQTFEDQSHWMLCNNSSFPIIIFTLEISFRNNWISWCKDHQVQLLNHKSQVPILVKVFSYSFIFLFYFRFLVHLLDLVTTTARNPNV